MSSARRDAETLLGQVLNLDARLRSVVTGQPVPAPTPDAARQVVKIVQEPKAGRK
ncbi:hypothetical protein GO986_18005 [Deinococcus sp. HMF7620]|uniref:Uncharacterized protein n=1 Tax=Deinococcus arboris TaxID=2682977 RepID=A0A7C9HTK7_9DEIO|nr:hypothetical protein [Deinococcus arboris]MVN88633.1 hypothetical protein [Deinococcus arboris]